MIRIFVFIALLSTLLSAQPTKKECWESYEKMASRPKPPPLETPSHKPKRFILNDWRTRRLDEIRLNSQFLQQHIKLGTGAKEDALAPFLSDVSSYTFSDGTRFETYEQFEKRAGIEMVMESAMLLHSLGKERVDRVVTSPKMNPERKNAEARIAKSYLNVEQKTLISLGNSTPTHKLLIENMAQQARLRGITTRRAVLKIDGSKQTSDILVFTPHKHSNSRLARAIYRKSPIPSYLVYAPTELADGYTIAFHAVGTVNNKNATVIGVPHGFARTFRAGLEEQHEFRHLIWNAMALRGRPTLFSGHAQGDFLRNEHFETGYNHAQSDEESLNYALALRALAPELREAKRFGDIEEMMRLAQKIKETALYASDTARRSARIAAHISKIHSRTLAVTNSNPSKVPSDFELNGRYVFSIQNANKLSPPSLRIIDYGDAPSEAFENKIPLVYQLPLEAEDKIFALNREDAAEDTQAFSIAFESIRHRFVQKHKLFNDIQMLASLVKFTAGRYIEEPDIRKYEALERALYIELPSMKTYSKELPPSDLLF